MPAHPQIPGAIEEDEAGYARVVNRSTQQGADSPIGSSRLVYDRAAKVVVIISEALETIGE
jgi:hypothetical protein